MLAYPLGGAPPARDPQWTRIRSALLRSNPGLHDDTFTPVPPNVKKPKYPDAPLVGSAFGRLWQITYQRPGTFSTDQVINLVTSIRWDEPERMILYRLRGSTSVDDRGSSAD